MTACEKNALEVNWTAAMGWRLDYLNQQSQNDIISYKYTHRRKQRGWSLNK